MRKLAVLGVALSLCLPFTNAYASKGGHSHSKSKKSKKSHSGSESTAVEGVSGYTKKDGTHVEGYDRTKGDHDKTNNWSTKGNVNPETGKAGYVDPDAPAHHSFWSKFHHHKPAA